MKKIIILTILLTGLTLSLTACGSDNEPGNTGVPQPNQERENSGLFDLSEGENGNAPTIKLSSGYDMPIVGLGTYSLSGDVCVNSVVSAIKNGFRKFDTAYMYHNEEEVSEGVRQSGIPREEVFVATKLYPNQFADAENAIDMALEKLDIGYIDLMLLHHPGANDVAAYKAMERIAEAHGKSPAQVILRWDLQCGVVVIPGSSNPAHQLENISIFDFELSDDEMNRIHALNRDEKHDWY